MASRKSIKKGTKKSARKSTARKGARGRAPARKAPKAGASLAPVPIKTGSGPSPLDVARDFVARLREGKFAEVEEKWLAPSIESVEGLGASLAWRGKKAVLAKYRGWEADHQIHDSKVEGPWVGATGFAVKFTIDVSQKSTGQRSTMEEIAVYTVRNGKVVREEFHFPAPA